jgi:hypothetical protein
MGELNWGYHLEDGYEWEDGLKMCLREVFVRMWTGFIGS